MWKLHRCELTRLYTQAIPLTFLGSVGQTSLIDHFIFDSRDNWSIIEQVNVLSSKSEYLRLKVSTDHENDIKGIWDRNTNNGDHRGMIVSKKKGENFIKYSKKIKWDSKLTQEKIQLYRSWPSR